MEVKVIGAGLAGCEAAYYLASKNIKVKLYEMRPRVKTDAHKTSGFAELVCSNSLRSNDILNAVGLLKSEMRMLSSLIIEAADKTQIPAGSSLAVDRELFSKYVEDKIRNHPLIEVINEEVTKINIDEYTIIACGPLASKGISKEIKNLFGSKELFFFDAVAPIISYDSINMDIAFLKSRYDKGEAAYINCPMDKKEYEAFYYELINAKTTPIKDFENNVFEGCMPVEVMAKRGIDTLLYGPLKPVGLEHNGKRYHAVVQLRQDDAIKSMYNIVGFQTNLKWGEQKRIINMIPGLENANIIRYGVMHKNIYIDAPNILNSFYQTKKYEKIFFAGQISGVEGYVESAASGLNAAFQIKRLINNKKMIPFPVTTVIGSMANYIAQTNASFVPMNANFGLLLELDKHKKKERKELYAKRAIESLKDYLEKING